MDIIDILFRPEEHHRLYNCINITVEDVPLEKRQHILEGIILIVLCTIYYILYIPCIPSIYRHMNNPCYKLLFFLSIVDCSILWVFGFLHGWFSITGVVYCSYPKFLYFLGSYIWAIWIFETSGQLALVINRCVAMLSSRLEHFLFGGRRLFFWLTASTLWSLYFFFFVKPLFFNGIYFSWFMNPYAGYREDTENIYVNNVHVAWDGSFCVGVPTLYIIFSILFFAKSHRMEVSKAVSKQQKMMLIQVFTVSVLNCVTTSTYVSMMFFIPNEFVIHFAQFCLFHIHGLPPVIFLVFNVTIRKDALRMVKNISSRLKGEKARQVTTTYNKGKPDASTNITNPVL